MESGDVYETLRALKQAAGFFEAYEVTRFTGHRKTQAGIEQEVDVEILDAGPDVDPANLRYFVRAFAKGKQASGNNGPTLPDALVGVHWWDLDS